MKKFVSVMLVLCMVLALVPAMAFAAAGDVAYIGITGFKTIQAAIDAAGKDGLGTEITVTASTTATNLVIDKSVSLVLADSVTVTAPTDGHPAFVVNAGGSLTIVGNGVISAADEETRVVDNYGTLTLKTSNTVQGKITNAKGATLNIASGNLWGKVENSGAVSVTGGTCHAVNGKAFFYNEKDATIVVNGGVITTNSNGIAFANKGTVTLDYKTSIACDLHGATEDSGKYEVKGGSYTDTHVLTKHSTDAYAGFSTQPGTGSYDEYWLGAQSMYYFANAYAAAGVGSSSDVAVDFMRGSVKLDDMPTADDGWYYWCTWDSHDENSGGRALVNGASDFNISGAVVSADKIPSNYSNTAKSTLKQNLAAISSVKAVYTGVTGNEVFYDIIITGDKSKLNDFMFDENVTGLGNYNKNHAWIPIALKFTDINGAYCDFDAHFEDKLGATSFNDNGGTYKWTVPAGCKLLWVGIDHVNLGQNSSVDLYDMDTSHGNQLNLIYHLTIKFVDEKTESKPQPEVDDPENAATGTTPSNGAAPTQKPSGEGDGPAKTGDNSTVMLWATLLVASAAGVAICVVDEAKKRSRK